MSKILLEFMSKLFFFFRIMKFRLLKFLQTSIIIIFYNLFQRIKLFVIYNAIIFVNLLFLSYEPCHENKGILNSLKKKGADKLHDQLCSGVG